jgi:hypothetical protein
MFEKVTFALALLGAAGVPAIASAQATDQADAMTVARDPHSGKLRAPTASELQTLKNGNGNGNANGSTIAPRSAPVPFMQKYHASGALGVRLNDEAMSSAVVTRTADGKLEMQCVEASHGDQAPHPAHTTLQPVTE